jgi:hypothetical protein
MGRGGMRFGAGRPAYRAKAEQLRRIDVRQWAARGYLHGACSFSWSWHRGEEHTGTIGVYVHGPDALTLCYTCTLDGVARDVVERLGIVSTPCRYGGARQWFLCPCCARRVALLYMRGQTFACRHCKRVAYSSQSEDAIDRMWRKQSKIEARLDANGQRPKGMRRANYERLRDKVWDCEWRREELLERYVAYRGMAGRMKSGS